MAVYVGVRCVFRDRVLHVCISTILEDPHYSLLLMANVVDLHLLWLNLSARYQLLCPDLMFLITSTFREGQYLTWPFFGILCLCLVILQASCTGVLVSMCEKLREMGSFKGDNLLEQFVVKICST